MIAPIVVEADCGNGHKALPNSICCPTCDAPPTWYDHIACADQATDVFFGGTVADRIALRCCAECPVRPYCLEKGWTEDYGVWGGLTESQRIKIRNLLQLDRVTRRQRRLAIRELASRPVPNR